MVLKQRSQVADIWIGCGFHTHFALKLNSSSKIFSEYKNQIFSFLFFFDEVKVSGDILCLKLPLVRCD